MRIKPACFSSLQTTSPVTPLMSFILPGAHAALIRCGVELSRAASCSSGVNGRGVGKVVGGSATRSGGAVRVIHMLRASAMQAAAAAAQPSQPNHDPFDDPAGGAKISCFGAGGHGAALSTGLSSSLAPTYFPASAAIFE